MIEMWLSLLMTGYTVPHVDAQPKFIEDRYAARQHEKTDRMGIRFQDEMQMETRSMPVIIEGRR